MRDKIFFHKEENSTSFIRFYIDGTVIAVEISSTEINIEKILIWFNKENYDVFFVGEHTISRVIY